MATNNSTVYRIEIVMVFIRDITYETALFALGKCELKLRSMLL